MKGSWRRYIREWLKGRTSESRGWPRTRWMPVSTRVRWKGCDGRMDRRRVVAGASTLSVQPALWATTSPPLGCRRSGGRGGAMPVGGGLAKPASAARLLAEGWIGAAPDARAHFQRSWKPRIAGSSSMRAGLSRVSRRCMRFLGFHFFLASVSFENSRIIGSSSILDERLFQIGNLWEYSNYLG